MPALGDSQPDSFRNCKIQSGEQQKEKIATAVKHDQWKHKSVLAGAGKMTAYQMADSTEDFLSKDWGKLRSRLALDGYLFIREIIPKEQVERVRASLLDALLDWKPTLLSKAASGEVILAEGASGLGLLQRQDLASADQVKQLVEAPALFDLVDRLLQVGGKVITTGYKWLRAVAQGEFTGLHCDRVFLGLGSERVLTLWLAVGSLSVEEGAMLVAAGSHSKRAFSSVRKSYGASQVGKDGTKSGWLSDDGSALEGMVGKYAVDWRTADFQAGDVVVLGLDVFHMTATNTTRRVRISCDTRWQPAGDARDPRVEQWNAK